MPVRFPTATAAAALTCLALLGACGGTSSTPTSSTSASVSQATESAAPSAAPTSGDSSAAPTPTISPADQSAALQDASEKFVTAVLTIGYPDKSQDAYLDRIEPLMTTSGFATVKKEASSADLDKAIATGYAAKVRSHPKIDSVKVSSVDASQAKTKVTYAIDTQRRTDGGYKTTKTSDSDSVNLTLAYQDGKWLVDTAEG